MKYLKNIGISFFYIIIILLILTFIITILNYFNLINSHIMAILQIITLIISLFIGGVIIGKKSAKKGWLEGLYLGIIFLFILLPLHY
ncbi:MAG: TIGR04086 family membrane protein, partial [Bacilli bacterium]